MPSHLSLYNHLLAHAISSRQRRHGAELPPSSTRGCKGHRQAAQAALHRTYRPGMSTLYSRAWFPLRSLHTRCAHSIIRLRLGLLRTHRLGMSPLYLHPDSPCKAFRPKLLYTVPTGYLRPPCTWTLVPLAKLSSPSYSGRTHQPAMSPLCWDSWSPLQRFQTLCGHESIRAGSLLWNTPSDKNNAFYNACL